MNSHKRAHAACLFPALRQSSGAVIAVPPGDTCVSPLLAHSHHHLTLLRFVIPARSPQRRGHVTFSAGPHIRSRPLPLRHASYVARHSRWADEATTRPRCPSRQSSGGCIPAPVAGLQRLSDGTTASRQHSAPTRPSRPTNASPSRATSIHLHYRKMGVAAPRHVAWRGGGTAGCQSGQRAAATNDSRSLRVSGARRDAAAHCCLRLHLHTAYLPPVPLSRSTSAPGSPATAHHNAQPKDAGKSLLACRHGRR